MLGKAKEHANRVKCASNLRQLVQGAMIQAGDRKRGVLFPNSDGANDTLGHIIPRYIRSANVAICPSTANSIRPNVYYAASLTEYGERNVLQDLHQPAADASQPYGHSYEVFGWYSGLCVFPDGTVIDGSILGDSNVQRGVRPGEPGYTTSAATNSEVKRMGRLRSPTTTILILDSDQDPGDGSKGMNNWPDARNNHGTAGVNMGFGDGHAEWVPRGPGLIDTYMRSYNGPAQDVAFTVAHRPGLVIDSVTIGGKAFTRYSYK